MPPCRVHVGGEGPAGRGPACSPPLPGAQAENGAPGCPVNVIHHVHVCSAAQSCTALMRPCGLQPTWLLCPWESPGKNTGVGCHAFLQGIFLTQGSNLSLLHLLHWQVGPLPSSHLGSCSFTAHELNSVPGLGDPGVTERDITLTLKPVVSWRRCDM